MVTVVELNVSSSVTSSMKEKRGRREKENHSTVTPRAAGITERSGMIGGPKKRDDNLHQCMVEACNSR